MRQVLLVRAGSASILFLAVFGTALATTGSPPHMRAIYAATLVMGLLGIAFAIGRIADLKRRWYLLLLWFLASMAAFDAMTAQGIAKRDLFDGWTVLYPAGMVFLSGLAMLHGWLCQVSEKRLGRLLPHGPSAKTRNSMEGPVKRRR